MNLLLELIHLIDNALSFLVAFREVLTEPRSSLAAVKVVIAVVFMLKLVEVDSFVREGFVGREVKEVSSEVSFELDCVA